MKYAKGEPSPKLTTTYDFSDRRIFEFESGCLTTLMEHEDPCYLKSFYISIDVISHWTPNLSIHLFDSNGKFITKYEKSAMQCSFSFKLEETNGITIKLCADSDNEEKVKIAYGLSAVVKSK